MSSGKIHGKVTLALVPSSFAIALAFSPNLEDGLFSAIGCLVGLVMEPDLDVDHKTKSEYRVYKIFKPFGLFWYALWLPYAKAVPHRHFISHSPLFGTLVRYTYLGIFIALVSLILGQFDTVTNLVTVYYRQIFWLFLGTANSDFGHWIMDNI